MKNIFFILFVIILLISVTACDEVNKIINPTSDEYLIDKTVSSSTTEQTIESGNDIKIIFPANCLNGILVLKIKKEKSVPAFTVTNTKLGSNVYNIKYSGNTVFSSPIKIIINYDKSQIPPGKSDAETIKGYIYANGNWKLGNYIIDETNSKIIYSLNDLSNPKIGKDNPVLLDNEGEIFIGDGYSTTDSGQEDSELLGFIKSCKYVLADADAKVTWSDGETSSIFEGDGSGVDFQPYWSQLETNPPKIVWSGNHIDVSYPGYQIFYHIYGDFNKDGSIKELTFEYDDKYGQTAKLILKDLPGNLILQDPLFMASYIIAINNDIDNKKYVIDFRISEISGNGKRTSSMIDWKTFFTNIYFKMTPY